MAIKQRLPKIETGYELGADRYGYFSIIQPEETTINYVKNPCFLSHAPHSSYLALGYIYKKCDLGYYYVNASGEIKDRDISITGGGAKITPINASANSCSIYYSLTLVAGTYTFSAYYSGGADHEFRLRVTNDAETIQYGEVAINDDGGLNGFQRSYVTFTIPAEVTVRLHMTEMADSLGRLSHFYTDMWQCENRPYMTQNFIGQSKLHTHDNTPGAYSWWGVPHYSESVRTDKAYESGKIIDLSSLGFKLTGIAGLGVNPINTVINPIASGGGIYEGSTSAIRIFTLIGRFYGTDLQDILTKRRDLYELIRPNGRNGNDQPTTLMFRIWDCAKKTWTGQPLFIYCRYTSGLEGALDSETSEDITITFTSEDPYIYSSYVKRYEIVPKMLRSQLAEDTLKVSPIFMLRDGDGVWTQLNMRLDDPTGLGKHGDLCVVENIIPDGTGGYYVYGTFDTVVYKGVRTTVNKIFRYNKDADTILALGSGASVGVPDGEIHRVIVAPSGDAFVVGSFTSAGGVANTHCIAKYVPGANAWHSVSSSILPFAGRGPRIFDVEYNNDDNIYVSGIFADIGGAADAWLLDALPVEGLARMNVTSEEWTMLPIARTMYVYPLEGNRITRLFRGKRDAAYLQKRIKGFISGSLMTFATPNTTGIVAWDGTETFHTNWRASGNYAGGDWPKNPSNPIYKGVIHQDADQFYFVTGNDDGIYKLEFIMPAHTKNEWSWDQGTEPFPSFSTVYTYPERDSPSKWKKLNTPFSRDVRFNVAQTTGEPADWRVAPLSQLRHSELKIINSRLTLSPNFGYGLKAYELDGSDIIPESKLVPLIWYLPLWKGDASKFSNLDIYGTQAAYSAAFDVNFGTGEAFIAVNTGHTFPQRSGDNHIFAVAPVVKAIINNGERTPVHIRITGPVSLGTFTNRTTEQTIAMDGHFVPLHGTANIVSLPANGSDLGEAMYSHMLDSSDSNFSLVNGKNIVHCQMDDVTDDTRISVIFRERYASIEKAIEYVGG